MYERFNRLAIAHSGWFLVLAAGVLMVLVLGVSLPAWPKISGVLNNAAHAPVFGLLAVIIWRLVDTQRWRVVRPMTAYGIALVVAVSVGGLIEIIQLFIDRDASWEDLGRDLLGAGCALGLLAAFDRRLWRVGTPLAARTLVGGLALACGVGALYSVGEAAIAYQHRAALFPIIAAFASPLDLYFIESASAQLSLQPLPTQWAKPGDQQSLRVDFMRSRLWPGVSHTEPAPDWRHFSTLALDLTNPSDSLLPITVRVHDVAHDQRHEDRFNRTFELAPLSRTVLTIPMADILHGPVHRELDLAQIAGVIVFAGNKRVGAGQHFYLTRIWLE